ncbi:MAG: PQQ-binding-like beta-propeller repeat protein [Candidatus Thermoplasmatota archaeon]|nr:PQQ-binding-like beta-propeller repeat protein [Candidatus Thermoplasmatota archaeon]
MKTNGSLKWISFGVMLVFMFTACSPSIFSTDTNTDDNILVEQLRFMCYGTNNSMKMQRYINLIQHVEDTHDNYVEPQSYSLIKEDYSVSENTKPLDSPWPMKCHDNRHTGRSPYSTMDNNGAELWKFQADRYIEGGPIVDNDGSIYFGDFRGNFYALDSDGSLKWKFDTGGTIWSAPALDEDGTIYVGSYDDFLYAINPDGSLKWRFWAGFAASITSSPAIANDGTIYFGAMGPNDETELGRIYAINPNGSEKWHYDTGYWITSDPAISDDGTVYIGSGDTYLYALHPNGTLRWRFKTGHYVKGPPAIADDGTIYFGSYDSYLYALYQDGSLKWKIKTGAGTETNPSIGPDGTIYVGDDKLYALNPDGTLKWTFDPGPDQDIFQSSPAVSADGIVYFGTNIGETSGGDIIAVNPDGTECWRRRIANNWVDSSPCIGKNGVVYIGSSSDNDSGYPYGCLYAFGQGEGSPNPPTITGPSSGKTGEEHIYTFSTTDPDGDNISYYVTWGDGTNSGWQGPYPSGTELSLPHTWMFQGTYSLKAKAKDEHEMESDWATLEVSMPKNKPYINTPFLRFLENHPYIFPVLKYLLRL